MDILVTNDDGIYAEGIQTLARTLKENGHRVLMAAPDRERSAAGHAITINNPLRTKQVYLLEGVKSYYITGTPADCVKLGVDELLNTVPDLIVSGINHGPNLGLDVLYSGTVSAAIEGWMMNINSIAVSLDVRGKNNFELGAKFISDFVEKLDFAQFRESFLFNINIPDCTRKELQGYRITNTSHMLFEDYYIKRQDPMGNDYFWLDGDIAEEFDEDSDIWAVKNNFVSISPLKIDLINQKHQQFLRQLNFQWK